MIFLGIDWAEAHHDLCLLEEGGRMLAQGRIPTAWRASGGCTRWWQNTPPIPPRWWSASSSTGACSLPGSSPRATRSTRSTRSRSIATATGTGSRAPSPTRAMRRCWPTSSAPTGTTITRWPEGRRRPRRSRSLARAHKDLIWARQRQANRLRNLLREFYPAALVAFGGELSERDALAVLDRAPSPEQGRRLTEAQIVAALRRGGRRRNLKRRAWEIATPLRGDQLEAPAVLAGAYAASVRALVAVLREMAAQVTALEQELQRSFRSHPDAEIYLSLPGLGDVLGARALGEFGDDRTRYGDPRSRKAYAGTAPITKASGTKRVVLARFARNAHLADACHLWAFSALSRSPGARRYYDALRARGKTHNQALRQLANRLVGILHACLERRELYREAAAWPALEEVAA